MSPGARDLFDAGRMDVEPSSQARSRLRSNLVGQLGTAAVMTTVSASAATNATIAGASGATTLMKVAVLLAIGGALSAGGYAAVHRSPAASPASVDRAPIALNVEPASAAPPPAALSGPAQPGRVPGPAESPAPVLPAVQPARREPAVAERALPIRGIAGAGAGEVRAAPAVPSTPDVPESVTAAPVDGLEAELSLVRAAHDALRAGQPALALERTEEHRRAYPDGTLAEERDALRVCAICALGRSDSQAEAQTFLSNHPASPFVTRIREACPR
jgi:hypothetical protein